MTILIRTIAFALLVGYAKQGFACPFCDAGGQETAIYITLVFGLFSLAAILLAVAAWRNGGLKNAEQVGARSAKKILENGQS